MTATQLRNIEAHGRKLLAIFPHATERDPVKLCKRLRRLEAKGAALALQLCNGPELQAERADCIGDDILDDVDSLLGFRAQGVPIFVNRDPRGYALKIDDDWMRKHKPDLHSDCGGYGIIAPEIEP